MTFAYTSFNFKCPCNFKRLFVITGVQLRMCIHSFLYLECGLTPKCLCDHFLFVALFSRVAQCKIKHFFKKLYIIFSVNRVLNLMVYFNFHLSNTLVAINFKKKTPLYLSSARKFAISRNYWYYDYVIINIFTYYHVLCNSSQSYQFSNAKIRNYNFY